MNIFKLLHTMSKIHDVVKPIKVGDIVKNEENKMFKVTKSDRCTYHSCTHRTPFCKLITLRSWDENKKPHHIECYRAVHRVSKSDRFIYHMQGRNGLNDYLESRGRRPATDSDDCDGIS